VSQKTIIGSCESRKAPKHSASNRLTRTNATDFKSFTVRASSKFVEKIVLKLLPLYKCIAIKPCEILYTFWRMVQWFSFFLVPCCIMVQQGNTMVLNVWQWLVSRSRSIWKKCHTRRLPCNMQWTAICFHVWHLVDCGWWLHDVRLSQNNTKVKIYCKGYRQLRFIDRFLCEPELFSCLISSIHIPALKENSWTRGTGMFTG